MRKLLLALGLVGAAAFLLTRNKAEAATTGNGQQPKPNADPATTSKSFNVEVRFNVEGSTILGGADATPSGVRAKLTKAWATDILNAAINRCSFMVARSAPATPVVQNSRSFQQPGTFITRVAIPVTLKFFIQAPENLASPKNLALCFETVIRRRIVETLGSLNAPKDIDPMIFSVTKLS